MQSLRRYKTLAGWVVSCSLIASVNTGCAVLTKSQVKEVNAFAKATQGFPELPSVVLDEYGVIHKERQLLELAADPHGSEADVDTTWKQMLKILEFSHQNEKDSQELHDNLMILDKYTALLLELSSDKFSDKLDENTARLGKSLDKAVKTYNEHYGKDYQSLGASAVGAVRAVGGVYIKYKQQDLLKHYVTEADDMIGRLTIDLETLLDRYIVEMDKLDGQLSGRLLQMELVDLKSNFQDKVKLVNVESHSRDLPLSTLQSTFAILSRIEDTGNLARKCKSLARNYREAHARLKQNLTRKQMIKDYIEEIQSIGEDMKAANKLRKSFGR